MYVELRIYRYNIIYILGLSISRISRLPNTHLSYYYYFFLYIIIVIILIIIVIIIMRYIYIYIVLFDAARAHH